jgi:hypothetical protein
MRDSNRWWHYWDGGNVEGVEVHLIDVEIEIDSSSLLCQRGRDRGMLRECPDRTSCCFSVVPEGNIQVLVGGVERSQ